MNRKKIVLGVIILLAGLMLVSCAVYDNGYYGYPYYHDFDHGYPYYGEHHEFREHHEGGGEHHEFGEHHEERERR